jgi:integrase/recombinase XerD
MCSNRVIISCPYGRRARPRLKARPSATARQASGSGRGARHLPPVTPHTLRHAFITAALDAGVPLRDVQEAASHADPRTTMRYDRARGSLDRHATYIVAAYVAGAAR